MNGPAVNATLHEKRTGWLAWRYLLLRRLVQVGVLGLFLLGPLAGIWVIRGNLASSMVLDTVPLSDPYITLQSWLTGHLPAQDALLGAVIIALFYFLVGGRAFCAWVCPVNIVTDTAHWLRSRLGLKGKTRIGRDTRYWILGATFLLAVLTGTLAWELVNPVSVLQRGIIFGMGAGWLLILAVFIFDLAVSHRGWCGHLCPMGAFYSLLGRKSPLRIRADQRDSCNKCMDCFEVCPEPQVIRPALFGQKDGTGPVITDSNCTNCGRCIDVCTRDVFRFGNRSKNIPIIISEQEEART